MAVVSVFRPHLQNRVVPNIFTNCGDELLDTSRSRGASFIFNFRDHTDHTELVSSCLSGRSVNENRIFQVTGNSSPFVLIL